MRAIVFGQSGLGKTRYMQLVAAIAQEHGKTLRCMPLGAKMHELDPEKQRPDKYPSLHEGHRTLLRQQAMQAILDDVEREKDADHVLIAHAVFRTDTGLATAHDPDLLQKFRPDSILVLIDDFHYVHRNLRSTEYRMLSFHDVLEWRNAEIESAKTVASDLLPRGSSGRGIGSWPFYLVPRGHDPEIVYRLLYEADERLKVYCSFPITAATDQQTERVNHFKAMLAKKHIAFDPLKIGERSVIFYADAVLEEIAEKARSDDSVSDAYTRLVTAIEKRAGSVDGVDFRQRFSPEEVLPGLTQLKFVPNELAAHDSADDSRSALREPYSFALDELQHLRGTVDGQIISRDHLLIDQSDIVCAYVPWNDALQRYDVSAGSQSELAYARMRGRDCLVVCEGKTTKASPWITHIATEVFKGLDDLMLELDVRASERRAGNTGESHEGASAECM